MNICTRRIIFLCALTLLPMTLLARDVLASGNGFDETSQRFSSNLAQIDHSFSFVAPDALMQEDLNLYDVVWLDGFSYFNDLWSGTLITFVSLGGTLIVQNPGFGSNSLESYPFGDELTITYTQPDFEDQVRIVEPFYFLNLGLTDEMLSSWRPTSAYGYFGADIDGFLGISDTSEDGEWVTIVREVGQGLLIYTQQAIIQGMNEQGLTANAGQLEFMRNVIRRAPHMESLTPPLFVNESNLWLSSNGDLNILFPNPNLDGFDTIGDANFSYTFSIEKLGDPVYSPEDVISDTWPVILTIPLLSLPEPPYLIAFYRKTNYVNMKNYESTTKFLNNPRLTELPFESWSFKRWLMHLPKKGGGFDGVIQLTNTNLAESSDVYLVGFDAEGNNLVQMILPLGPGETQLYELYGQGPDGIFDDPELFDMISHLAIWERVAKTQVSVEYVSVKSGFGVWADHVDMEKEVVNGREFLLSGTAPDSGYWDGVALLNLSSRQSVTVDVARYDRDGNPAGEESLGTLDSGQKELYVLSDLFRPFLAGASYRISGREGDIQILGLSGIKTGDFFAPAKVTRLR